MSSAFPPTRAAGLERLAAFVPKAGRDYRAGRNFDFGPGAHTRVSGLSPYLRHRLVGEAEVVEAVLAQHTFAQAEKFVQEVFWRTYWKGWLEHRPSVWAEYLDGLDADRAALDSAAGQRAAYQAAVEGRTGIAPFDAWAHELRSTGYVHNHARMWFASIWIFTLSLPWRLGADFFLRHLLDGDPASNTLSWRWVAGLHTRGKTYLTTASNLRKYAHDRFFADGEPVGLERLAGKASALAETPAVPAVPPEIAPAPLPDGRAGFLLTEEDLLLELPATPIAVAALDPDHDGQPDLSADVLAFKAGAVTDALSRAAATCQGADVAARMQPVEGVAAWAAELGLNQVWLAYVPVGYNRPKVQQLRRALEARGCRLCEFVREHDRAAWPHATKGYFQLRKALPDLIRSSSPQEVLFA